jgi:YVTN family beta-propeller protein
MTFVAAGPGLADPPFPIMAYIASPRVHGLGVNPVTNRVYVTHYDENSISVINGETNSLITTITGIGEAPCDVAVNSSINKIYVANCNAGSPVSVIDGTTNTVIASIPVGINTKGIAVNSETNRIYVTSSSGGNIHLPDLEVIDGSTDTVIASLNQPDYTGASAVAVNPVTDRVYVRMHNSVHVLDGATNTFIAAITGIASHTDARHLIDVNPETNMVYTLRDHFGGPLYIIDGSTNTVVDALAVPPSSANYAISVAVNPTTNHVFVSRYNSGISVLNGGLNEFLPDMINLASGNLAVNPQTNRIYVANGSIDGGLWVIGDRAEISYKSSTSGRIIDGGGIGIANVIVPTNTGQGATTNPNGDYTITGLLAGTHTITPCKAGYIFSPSSRTVSVPPNATGQDFTGSSASSNLCITHIEVTQVIQDENNAVPLIAGKPVFVRVYVDCGQACTGQDPVSGTLQVSSSAGSAIYWPSMGPIVPEHPPTPPGWISQRGDMRKTLNFYTISTALLAGDVTFTAQVGDATLSETLSFVPGKKLSIAWVPVRYQPFWPFPPIHSPDEMIARQAMSFMGKTFPLAWTDLDYFQQPLQPAEQDLLTFTIWHQFTERHAWNVYLNRLDRVWQMISAANGWRNGQPDRLFGWVPSEARPPGGGTYGYAYAAWWCPSGQPGSCGSGRVAAGLAQPLWLGDLKMPSTVGLAHEIAHLLDDSGLKHAACGTAGSPDVPLPGGRIDNWGIDFMGGPPTLYSPAPMHANAAYDFMSYCSPGWVSIFHYRRLEEGFQDYSPQAQNLYTSYRVLSVLGTVYTPTLTVDFGTFYPLDSVVPPDASRGTDYCLELRNADEILLDSRCIDLAFKLPESGEAIDEESFTLLLPYPEETSSLVLTYKGSELDRVPQSNNAPTVQLLSPNGGEVWSTSGTYTVTWTASDADGDPLRFMVSYSDDDGETWMPLTLDITNNFLVVDSPNIPGSTTARFKVTATDQMLTGEDISDASFMVGSKGPAAFILLPDRERTIPPGLPLYLQGYAYDLEDGTLKDNALRWASSIDGDLGTGQTILAMLSPGEHTITLTATDSDGNQDTATLNLYIGYRNYLPLMLRTP